MKTKTALAKDSPFNLLQTFKDSSNLRNKRIFPTITDDKHAYPNLSTYRYSKKIKPMKNVCTTMFFPY